MVIYKEILDEKNQNYTLKLNNKTIKKLHQKVPLNKFKK